MAPALDTLTEDHAAVYDRQLRVWGLEVQRRDHENSNARRLMEAKVLIMGLGGLAAEIAKNIVLAGVGTVALMDDTPVAAAAPGNFLVEHGAAEGRSVAEACAGTLQAMNPLMKVTVEPGPASAAALLQGDAASGDQSELRALLGRYDCIMACGLPLVQVAALDDVCRELGRQLFAGAVHGPSSYVFADLGARHVHTKQGDSTELVMPYSSFREAMTADLAGINKRTHPMYLVLRACYEFEQAQGRPASGPEDIPGVCAVAERLAAATSPGMAAADGAAAAKVLLPEGFLEGFVLDRAAASGQEDGSSLGELAPVCAVVGGVVANSVLRGLSHVGLPLHNMFCYSQCVRDGLGIDECFPGSLVQ